MVPSKYHSLQHYMDPLEQLYYQMWLDYGILKEM